MKSTKAKQIFLVLRIVFFFVLFFSFSNNISTAQAKELTPIEDTTKKETQPEIKLNVKSKELVKEKSFRLKIYNTPDNCNITYKSSDTSIVTVNEDGLVKGVDYGKATVTVTVKDNNKVLSTLQCDITVGVPAISVRITTRNLIMVVGQSTTLKVLVAPYNTVEETRYKSLDSNIASISTGGRLSAKSAGTTRVYALIDNGYSVCNVTVIDEKTYEVLAELGITDLSEVTNLEEYLPTVATESAIEVIPEADAK